MKHTNHLFHIAIALCCWLVSCNRISNRKIDISRLEGEWLGIGYTSVLRIDVNPDDFYPLHIKVLDKNTIQEGNNTLYYNTAGSTDGLIVFYSKESDPDIKLTYNLNDKSIEYVQDYSSGGYTWRYNLFTALYKPNPSIKNYVSKIVGARTLSGTRYDTVNGADTPNYSSQPITANIAFTIVDDSTIRIDKDFLLVQDSVLHYKSTDYAAKTITFQNFHIYSISVSTVTYNYENETLIFEQRVSDLYNRAYVKLQ